MIHPLKSSCILLTLHLETAQLLMSLTGIWTRDLRSKTNLQQPQINKILKTLDSRSLVKSVKSVANANRKVYMLFELEPARDLTGGAW